MAMKLTIPAFVKFVGDGSDKTIAITLATAPIGLTVPNGGELTPTFSISSPLPNAVRNIGGTGLAVSSSSYTLGVLSVTFEDAPNNGETYQLGFELDYSA